MASTPPPLIRGHRQDRQGRDQGQREHRHPEQLHHGTGVGRPGDAAELEGHDERGVGVGEVGTAETLADQHQGERVEPAHHAAEQQQQRPEQPGRADGERYQRWPARAARGGRPSPLAAPAVGEPTQRVLEQDVARQPDADQGRRGRSPMPGPARRPAAARSSPPPAGRRRTPRPWRSGATRQVSARRWLAPALGASPRSTGRSMPRRNAGPTGTAPPPSRYGVQPSLPAATSTKRSGDEAHAEQSGIDADHPARGSPPARARSPRSRS